MSDKIQEAREKYQAATNAAAADRAAHAAAPPQKAVRKPGARSKAGAGRWATLNGFVDVIAPRLALADRAVWLAMFRHARDGRCETTVRTLAASVAVSRATVERSLRRLCEAGLIWSIWKSNDKSQPSKYGIHPDPAACLPRLCDANQPSSP